ncbi:tRNA dihydrouridine(20/20a) synthase DusA [Synechococcus sp. RSCCF101]|uniref:tRNA dihydrouridine(20/20a) synthase DusA n=1 Tax=Synechococcus sp. RSCCF101 TaxID=2511069 RepID=UPI001247004B|nr:tRNA dihydrouridine(20/20a) synthase DusA [Synechococcus sp. RSCCF101]QEY32572.1 tRNA dihydrouridine(20/20a) synthase DusA [Synechococcus sp. RSCCF101]
MATILSRQAPPHRFSVAPMMDCTDRHFRVLMRQISRRCLLYTEMVVANALHHARRRPPAERERCLERLIGFDGCERPLVLQLGGEDPQLLAEAAELAAEWGYDELNLNVGCPSPRVRSGRFGACLMDEPERVARCVRAMAQASGLPVSVKHRVGLNGAASLETLERFMLPVAAAGACRFSVHARSAWLEGLDPKQNRTVPPLRHDLVQTMKARHPELVIELNGGLEDLEQCRQALGWADGVMVGRAAYGHPLRWSRVDQVLFGEGRPEPSAALEPSRVLLDLVPYAERWCEGGGRLWALGRHLVHLVEGLPGARRWRQRFTTAACRAGAGAQSLVAAAAELAAAGH